MTEARREEICAAVAKDQEKAKKLLAMTPEEVAAALKDEGYDFSVEEIKEVGAEIQAQIDALKNGELREEDLVNVAGGASHATSFFLGMGAAGVAVGILCCGW